jgi:hypothetical protein
MISFNKPSIKKMVLYFLIILFVFLYNSDKVMFELPRQMQDKLSIGVENQFDKIRTPVMKSIDAINPMNWKFGSQLNLPEFNLHFTRSDLSYISNVISRAKEKSFISNNDNEFRNTKLTYKGEVFKAKFRLHGSNYPNYINPKKSFAIKMKKGVYLENMRRFSFIILDEMSIPAMFAYKISSFFNGINVRTNLVNLKINGIQQGLYFMEEKVHKTLLEKNNLSGFDILKQMDEWDNQYGSGHQDPYAPNTSYTKFKNISKKNVGQLERYEFLMKNSEDYHLISKVIDIDNFAKFDALRFLFGTYHPIQGDNLRYLYDTSTGKISPYFRIENYLESLESNFYSGNFEKTMYFSSNDTKKNNDNLIFQTLVKNDSYRKIRNQYLWHLVSKKDKILSIYDDLVKRYHSSIKRDTTGKHSSRYYLHQINKSRNNLNNNFNKIKSYLEYSRVFTDVKINGSSILLEISPDSNSPLLLKSFSFYSEGLLVQDNDATITDLSDGNSKIIRLSDIDEYFSNIDFNLSLDNNLDNNKNLYRYRISLKENRGIDSIKADYVNRITGGVIVKNNYTSVLKTPNKINFDYINTNIDEFIDKSLEIKMRKVDDNTLTFATLNVFIKNDLILPYGIDLVIRKGTNIEIAPNASIVVYGSLNILGEKDSLVTVTSSDEGPFGVLAAIGNGESKVIINYLNLSRGSESSINGAFISGALSLYNHNKVVLNNTKVHGNYADDGLNIKNSDVTINNSEFYNNFSDQVDLDMVNALVINSKFNSSGGSSNGDGLDLSGSLSIVGCSIFENFPDKGISIGERSKVLLFKSLLKKNHIAVAAKDGSHLYLFNNDFEDNTNKVSQYIKKKIFNAPKVMYKEKLKAFNYNRKCPISGDLTSLARRVGSELFKGDK